MAITCLFAGLFAGFFLGGFVWSWIDEIPTEGRP